MKRWFQYMFCLLLVACSNKPFAESNKLYKKQVKEFAKLLRQAPLSDSLHNARAWVGTTHFNLRKPNYVILHHTAQNSCGQTLRTFTNPKSPVSAHYVVCRDGTVYHMLNDYFRAWHGGVSRWGNITDINSSSIGIELDNNGTEAFPEVQIASLLNVLSGLKTTYAIPVSNFIGHADIAPTRKQDPSRHFPWRTLADKGFGHWYSDTTGITVPEQFNHLDALRIIGYDARDSAAAIKAFKLHFMSDTLHGMTMDSRKILYTLYRKYQ